MKQLAVLVLLITAAPLAGHHAYAHPTSATLVW
jgi:hypothetical protein